MHAHDSMLRWDIYNSDVRIWDTFFNINITYAYRYQQNPAATTAVTPITDKTVIKTAKKNNLPSITWVQYHAYVGGYIKKTWYVSNAFVEQSTSIIFDTRTDLV